VVVSSGPGNATVPSVINQSCAQAQATVQGAGFQTTVSNQFSADVQNGNAIGTDPGANAQAAKGSTVKIFCSQGASPSPTPSNSPSPTNTAGNGGGFIGGLGGGTPSQTPTQ
jgi:beta-lactam-binding protein with PASTA domain